MQYTGDTFITVAVMFLIPLLNYFNRLTFCLIYPLQNTVFSHKRKNSEPKTTLHQKTFLWTRSYLIHAFTILSFATTAVYLSTDYHFRLAENYKESLQSQAGITSVS
jgi:hypothetical protein